MCLFPDIQSGCSRKSNAGGGEKFWGAYRKGRTDVLKTAISGLMPGGRNRIFTEKTTGYDDYILIGYSNIFFFERGISVLPTITLLEQYF